ncbi:protein-export chaperone SecB [Hellea sp.]|nr:protein-export chaperone SecB [Hellea sp.]MDA8887591.1 protein-export chaperone SecB [Hellea sp.]MDB4844239.1 protein-export chaperone SecB [Hellea sp.]MDC0651335.1 protein-export chaperone SecB [Hellea sp.]MDC1061266.1 protein-export chaperone SecB [Hellea sp.]
MAKKPKKEKNVEPETKEQVSETQKAPMLSVLAQYTKDQSFENPNAPDSLRSGLSAPEIQINIEIGRQMLEGDNVEVTLMLKAEAKRGDTIAFIAELEYAGLFAFAGVSAEEIQPLIMIECPRLLFPFSRQIMAEMTQNGGFPPIMLEPPDFAGMFRDEMMRRAADQSVN